MERPALSDSQSQSTGSASIGEDADPDLLQRRGDGLLGSWFSTPHVTPSGERP